MSLQDQLHQILTDLDDRMPNTTLGCLLASSDGFLITETLRMGDPEQMAAMVATTVGVSRRMASTLDAGTLNETTIAGDERQMMLYLIGREGVLAVAAQKGSNVALINIAAREAADKARKVMASLSTEAA